MSRPVQPKDLINLRNLKNGEVYRFSCRTCIDGHRAPLCDPKKHRGKVMFRRPNPGRPARQCGHPKTAQCDCLAKRTLCCILSSEQWDQVVEGRVVPVEMYDSLTELEAAQANAAQLASSSIDAISTPSPGSDGTTNSGTFRLPSRQTTVLPLMGLGGPQGSLETQTDPFAWKGTAPQYPPSLTMARAVTSIGPSQPTTYTNAHHTFQAKPQPSRKSSMSSVQSPYSQFQIQLDPQTPGKNSDSAYASDTTRSTSRHGSSISSAGEVQQHMLRQFSMASELAQLTPTMRDAYVDNISPHIMDMDSMGLLPGTTLHSDTPVSGIHRTPQAQEAVPSCCSSRARPPIEPDYDMDESGSGIYPSAVPLGQFPCSSCASSFCTCSSCPSTMQSFDMGGAWSQACTRAGHMDEPYLPNYGALPPSMHPPPPPLQPSSSSSPLDERHLAALTMDGLALDPAALGDWQGLPADALIDAAMVDPSFLHQAEQLLPPGLLIREGHVLRPGDGHFAPHGGHQHNVLQQADQQGWG